MVNKSREMQVLETQPKPTAVASLRDVGGSKGSSGGNYSPGSTDQKHRGNRRDLAPAIGNRDALTSQGAVVAARLSKLEVEVFGDFIKQQGFASRGAALRSLVRASVGILVLQSDEVVEFTELRREVALVGGNINQMARLAAVGRLELAADDRALLAGLETAIVQLRTYLADVVNEHRRRNIRLFREFAEAEHGR